MSLYCVALIASGHKTRGQNLVRPVTPEVETVEQPVQLLDYQMPVEQARRRLGMAELPFVQLQRIPLKLIVSRHAPGAEALRDALDRAYQELSAAGEDLRLP